MLFQNCNPKVLLPYFPLLVTTTMKKFLILSYPTRSRKLMSVMFLAELNLLEVILIYNNFKLFSILMSGNIQHRGIGKFALPYCCQLSMCLKRRYSSARCDVAICTDISTKTNEKVSDRSRWIRNERVSTSSARFL